MPFRRTFLALLVAAALACSRPAELPKLYDVPDVTLTSQHHAPVRLRAVGGKAAIYDFIFTRCGSSCPMMTRSMKSIASKFSASDPIRFVSVTVDPRNDTPDVLHSYWQHSAGGDSRWFFLTGEQQVIDKVSVDGFRLAASQGGGGQAMHSTKFILVDGRGSIRGYYDFSSPEQTNRLVSDAKQLLRE